MKHLKVAYATMIFTGLIILLGVGVYATIPWLLDAYIKNAAVPLTSNGRNTILVLLYCVGIPVLAQLIMGFKMTLNIYKGESFVMQNVRLLNLISICAAISGVMFLVATFFLNSVFPVIIFVIFLLLSFFSRIFAKLFASAIAYKEENELTI